jgi:hypothetical protein
VTLAKRQPAKEPGYTIDTFPLAMQERILKEYRSKYPDRPELRPADEQVFQAPPNYYDGLDHFRVFFDAMRTRKPVVEDATFGFRAAGPALLTNESYFEGQPVAWDPEKMHRSTPRTTA